MLALAYFGQLSHIEDDIMQYCVHTTVNTTYILYIHNIMILYDIHTVSYIRYVSYCIIQLDQEDTSLSLKTTYSSIAALSLHPGAF